jgi:hypothetical protein
MNSPLMYVDENGEFLWTVFNFFKDLFVNTFIKSWSQGFNAWSNSDNWHNTAMAWEIDKGWFRGNPLQIISRFTWELPQTLMGYVVNGAYATFGGVKSVTHWGGATAVETYASGWGGFTLGSFIMGERGLQADPNNPLFQHEYGHYLQSQAWGWAYLSRAAIPSLFDTFGRKGDHKFHPIEQDANMRAFKYFNEHVAGFYQTADEYIANNDKGINKGWNFNSNPLNINGDGIPTYVDYKDAAQMALVNALKVSPSVFDYMFPIIYGFRNHVYYNKHKFRINY